MKSILYLFCCILLSETLAQQSCQTPNNTTGFCIPIKECPALYNLQENWDKTREQTTFLRSSVCSREGGSVQVCCEDGGVAVDSLLPTRSQCGMESSQNKIIGGDATEVDQFPWTLLIEYDGRKGIVTGCGASLISSRYALTAAHCVTRSMTTHLGTPINVRLGEYDTSHGGEDCVYVYGGQECTDPAVTIAIESIIVHPGYEPRTSQKNDIAMLRFFSAAPNTEFIRPICLPTSDVSESTGRTPQLTIAGWGVTQRGKTSDVKQYVSVPFVDMKTCQAAYSRPRLSAELWEKQLCAGGEEGKDSCKGDSGGPLMGRVGSQWTLHGVISFGPTPCAMADTPGVFTKVFAYLHWIRSQIKP